MGGISLFFSVFRFFGISVFRYFGIIVIIVTNVIIVIIVTNVIIDIFVIFVIFVISLSCHHHYPLKKQEAQSRISYHSPLLSERGWG